MHRSWLALALLLGACSRCDGPSDARARGERGASASATAPSATAPPATARGPAEVVAHVVDVGTGLAVFVEGGGFTMLYDGGSNDDLRDAHANRLVAYLRAVRPDLHAIDHVVLSHAHRDHVELLADVLDDYDVHDVWEPGALAKPCAYQRFVHAVAEHPSTRYHTAQPGGTRAIELPESSCKVPRSFTLRYEPTIAEGQKVELGGGASMTFLHVDGARHENLNENSLVVRIAIGDRSLLLAGDAEGGKRAAPEEPPTPRSVEGLLLARHGAELRSDVLVVGHHGSKTSTRKAFLDAVAPSVSIVSSGPHAYDGHVLPDPEVLDELRRRGPVFRTDADDAACAVATAKIGRDADGRPGGCDNVRVTLRPGEQPLVAYFHGHD
jgi:beta-lactamase superfamily II metal-dependent hydrolase